MAILINFWRKFLGRARNGSGRGQIRRLSLPMYDDLPPASRLIACLELEMIKTGSDMFDCNIYLSICNVHNIYQAYGFDYDYTLAIYKFELNKLIYDLALQALIDDFKVPN